MSTGIWSAASGAVTQTTALEVAATNIASATTPGYRADRAVFRQELARAVGGNTGTRSLRYAVVRTVQPDMQSGNITHTGRQLDVAIKSENAFFAVSTPKGERFTRAGNVQLSRDGQLTTPEGFPFIGPDRRPLRVPPGTTDVKISPDGSLVLNNEPIPSNLRLSVVTFDNPAALEKEGGTLLRAGNGTGQARPTTVDLETEALEMSNSSAIQGMSSMVTASRQFDMLARVIEAFSSVDHKAATEIMKR